MKIRALASSSAGCVYAINDGHTPFLLECGVSYPQIQQGLWRLGWRVESCLLSHEHGDHSCCAAKLMERGIDVYASRGTFEAMGLEGHRAHHVRAGEPFRVGSFNVMPFAAIHDAAEPLGFVAASQAGKLLYLSDSAYSPFRFEGLTHIMLECNYALSILRQRVRSGKLDLGYKNRLLRNHLGLERVLDLLASNDLTKVREIHLLHLSDGNSDEELFKKRVAAATGKPVYVAPKNSRRIGGRLPTARPRAAE